MKRPRFELKRVLENGGESPAEIVPVTALPWQCTANRRGFLGACLTAAAALMLIDRRVAAQGPALPAPPTLGSAAPGEVASSQPASAVPARAVRAHSRGVIALEISSDSRVIVSSNGSELKVWALPDGQLRGELPATCHLMTPDAATLVVGNQTRAMELSTAPSAPEMDSPKTTTRYLQFWSLSTPKIQRDNARATPDGQEVPVTALATSPDGRLLVSAGNDGSVRLWTMPAGRLLKSLALSGTGANNESNVLNVPRLQRERGARPPARDAESLIALQLASDGALLAGLGKQKVVYLWNLRDSGTPVSITQPPETRRLLLAPGPLLITEHGFWSAEGQLLAELHMSSIALASDRKMLATGDAMSITLWGLPDRRQLAQWPVPRDKPTALAFTPDGSMLICGSRNGTVYLVGARPRTRELLKVTAAAKLKAGAVLVMPDGRLLGLSRKAAAAARARGPRGRAGFHAEPLEPRGVRPEPVSPKMTPGRGRSLPSPSSRRPAIPPGRSGSKTPQPSAGRLLNAPDGVIAAYAPDGSLSRETEIAAARTLAVSPDGAMLACAGEQRVTVLSLPSLKTVKTFSRGASAVAISPDGKTLATLGTDKQLRLWTIADGHLQSTFKARYEPPVTLAFTPESKSLLIATETQIVFCAIPDGAVAASIARQSLWMASDTKRAVVRESNGKISLIALPRGERLSGLEGHTGRVTVACATNDRALLATGGEDQAICLWSLATGALQRTLRGHAQAITALAITADGKLIASGSADGQMRIWSVADGDMLHVEKAHEGPVERISSWPDSATLLTQASDEVRLWKLEIETRTEVPLLGSLHGHHAAVTALSVSPDGRTLASASQDGVVILWDLATRQLRCYLFDPAVNDASEGGVTFNAYDKVTGRMLTYTLPCGSPIPAGAVCTCNCVPGTLTRSSGGGGRTICTCDRICTCVPMWRPR